MSFADTAAGSRMGSCVSTSSLRICLPQMRLLHFSKKEYGIGGHSHTYLNGESGFVDHDGKGIHFSNHNYKEKHTITWKVVARRLRELIALDRYLTEKEKAYLPQYEAKGAERR